jgi:hypothetical protein
VEGAAAVSTARVALQAVKATLEGKQQDAAHTVRGGGDSSAVHDRIIRLISDSFRLVWALQEPGSGRAFAHHAALEAACSEGDIPAVGRLLHEAQVDPAADDNVAIRSASEGGHLMVVNRLLQDPRVDPPAVNNYAIGVSSQGGHLPVVDRLLRDTRVNPGADTNYTICLASHGGHVSVVRRLLRDPRVDPAADRNFAIRAASGGGHLAVVACLLQDPRVNPAAENNDAICEASARGQASVVLRLLECRDVLLAAPALVASGRLTVAGALLKAQLRRDALTRRAHVAAAVLRRQRGAGGRPLLFG